VTNTTSTTPAACAGVTKVSWVSFAIAREAAGAPPSVTAETWLKSTPVAVISVPPSAGPADGASTGTTTVKVNGVDGPPPSGCVGFTATSACGPATSTSWDSSTIDNDVVETKLAVRGTPSKLAVAP